MCPNSSYDDLGQFSQGGYYTSPPRPCLQSHIYSGKQGLPLISTWVVVLSTEISKTQRTHNNVHNRERVRETYTIHMTIDPLCTSAFNFWILENFLRTQKHYISMPKHRCSSLSSPTPVTGSRTSKIPMYLHGGIAALPRYHEAAGCPRLNVVRSLTQRRQSNTSSWTRHYHPLMDSHHLMHMSHAQMREEYDTTAEEFDERPVHNM